MAHFLYPRLVILWVSKHVFGFLYWRCCKSTYLGSLMVQMNISRYDFIINWYSFSMMNSLPNNEEKRFIYVLLWLIPDTYHLFLVLFVFSFLLFVRLWWQGLDALGLATLDSLNSMTAARVPFGSLISVSMMTKEDVNNLRTLGRLILLLSGSQENDSNQVYNSLLLLTDITRKSEN